MVSVGITHLRLGILVNYESIFAGNLAGDAVGQLDLQLRAALEIQADPFAQLLLCGWSIVLAGNYTKQDEVRGALHELHLADIGHVGDHQGERWTGDLPAVREHQKVRDSALHVGQQWQLPAARAVLIFRPFSYVADFIADQRHAVVQEIGDQNAPRFAGAGKIRFNLDQQRIGVHVHAAMELAFAGDDTDFAASVAVENFSTKGFFQKFTLAGQEHFRRSDNRVDLNIADLLLPQIARKGDSGLRIRDHCARLAP